MIILEEKMSVDELNNINEKTFFEDMIKAVVDIEQEKVAINAELHADLESLLLENNSSQENLYGINFLLDPKPLNYEELVEFDSLINAQRNRQDGYPRIGRDVGSPEKKDKIYKVVSKWITI